VSTDVAGWLRSLGLSQYEATFRESVIEADIIAELTDNDLEKLGIPLGDRKRLLKAITLLRDPTNASVPANLTDVALDAAERRQLTVLFCDLVGSTVISAQLDPEDMRKLVRTYQQCCATTIGSFDGFIAQYLGDGIMAYFGYPKAHEDDPERAVRAGLELIAAVAKLDVKPSLTIRIGIATGPVVVGDLIGQGAAIERAVTGETPNLAARLQALAKPGSIVVSGATRRLLGGLFILRDLGEQNIRGLHVPVQAFAVEGERETVSRFEAARSERMTPFIGREHELALLTERWSEARNGEGHVILLSGEAGIGKSRILAALRERIGDEPYITMRYQCSPHHRNDPFYPIIGQIWHAAAFESGESAPARLDKLETMVARSGLAVGTTAPYLASLLSIPTSGRYAPIEIAPSEMKERIISTLMDLFFGVTKDAPVLAILEDAHWIDPTSLDLFGRVIEKAHGLRALLAVTFRPEFEAPWVGQAHVSTLTINRFGRRHALAMIKSVTGSKPLPPEVLEEIVSKTDGVPLFVEELTKTVLESTLLREENGAYFLDKALTPLAIPATLQDSLMERLDRLAPVREIAQIGAAIGREFSYLLLEAVCPVKGAALAEALGQLTTAQLIHSRGTPPHASYVFKHALVQDTAYSSLLRSRRQRIHAAIADAMVEGIAGSVESAPAVIAHHYTEAARYEPAVRHWLAAAETALSRSANQEGFRFAEKGLTLIEHLAEGSERRELELALQVARGNAALALKGYTAAETVQILTEVKAILDGGIGTDMQRFSVLYGLWAANYVAARIAIAQDLGRQYLEIAKRQGDPTYLMIGERIVGAALIAAGNHREGLASLRKAAQRYEPTLHRPLSYRFGQDIGLSVLCHEVWAFWFMGSTNEAAELSRHIVAEIAAHSHTTTVAFCMLYGAIFPAIFAREFDTAAQLGEQLVSYCIKHKTGPHYIAAGRLCVAVSTGMKYPTVENIEVIRTARQKLHEFGVYVLDTPISAVFAEILLAAGDLVGAAEILDGAVSFAEESGERYWLAELFRLKGQSTFRLGSPHATSAAHIEQAIAVAREQEAISLERRAAVDLAQLRAGDLSYATARRNH
jgi:class 3 adenylate cyclase/predicted ATPase